MSIGPTGGYSGDSRAHREVKRPHAALAFPKSAATMESRSHLNDTPKNDNVVLSNCNLRRSEKCRRYSSDRIAESGN